MDAARIIFELILVLFWARITVFINDPFSVIMLIDA